MDELEEAADLISQADAILIGAGAGMGVDSGLPDFRGSEGFWKAYPRYAELGLRFSQMADPDWFRDDPAMAWGFYGHRRNLYRDTEPHEGFELLRRWAQDKPGGAFVFTSNVDGQFQRAGFGADRVAECHGAIDWSQCAGDCHGLFKADTATIAVDPDTMRASGKLPSCPSCGGLARPNIMMFGDWGWDGSRAQAQERRLTEWLGTWAGERLVAIELGAGTTIPTVRTFCEEATEQLVRINPREAEAPAGSVGLWTGALEGLVSIQRRLGIEAAC